MFKNIKNQILYILSIIFDIASVVGIMALAYLSLIYFSEKLTGIQIYLYSIGIVVCFFIHKAMFYVRTNSREKIEFDDKGNKKGNLYKNLSSKDKRKIDMQRLADSERVLSSSEMKKVTSHGSINPELELEGLIGLNNVKKEVLQMKATMEYNKKYKNKNTEDIASYHMCFIGSPGTGKTTVARIMTGILYRYKYIKKNQCIEIDSSFLKGSSPDETIKRTKMILNKASGGVLFIDEAYSLLSGINGNEIIAEIVKHMEDNKRDFVLILAGYQNDMKSLIYSNPGLYSRINKYLWFKDYTINELRDIFTSVANQAGYCVDHSACARFETRIMKEMAGKNFGNARSVRNIFQKILDKHAYNVMNGIIDKDKAYTITGEDVDIVTEESEIFNS